MGRTMRANGRSAAHGGPYVKAVRSGKSGAHRAANSAATAAPKE